MNTLTLLRTSILAILLHVIFLQKADAQTQVTWMNIVGATQSGDSIKDNASSGFGNSGASSVNWLPGGQNGYVQFYYNNVSHGTFVLGFSRFDMNQNYTTIDYGVYFDGTNIQVYSSGSWLGSFGTITTGDSVRITRTGDSIVISKDSVPLYTAI